MRRIGWQFICAITVVTASCGTETRSPNSRELVSPDSVKALQTQMQTVEDSIGKLLGQFESSSTALERVDSARTSLESQVTRIAVVNERLATNAPGVYARLSTFVEQHKRLVVRVAALDDTISSLRKRIRTLESRNSTLRSQVSALHDENSLLRGTVTRLLADSATRTQKIAQLDSTRQAILERTSRAYVAIASRDSLSRLGIAGKTNFLRLGATVLKRFDSKVFRLIDTRRDTIFPINVAQRDLEVLSTHPSGSYVLVDTGGATELRIIDADSFWSISRTLTVMTNR